MKRKRTAASDSLVPQQLVGQSAAPFQTGQRQRPGKCVVCGADVSSTSTEQLCWVCRRLKISAWGDTEQQMPAQE
jgi:hypothetical protein